jgi:hypothetical protein
MAQRLVIAVIASAIWLISPTVALAQADPIVPAWGSIPDLIGYVSWRVTPYSPACEAEPVVVWNDPTSPFRWLAWRISSLMDALICFLLNVAQFFANVAAEGLNLLIYGLNEFWRFLIYSWLTIRQWLLAIWGIVELMREFWRMLEALGLLITAWLAALFNLILLGLGLIGQALLILLGLFGVLINLISWFGMLILSPMLAILDSFSSTASPVVITGSHPVYQAVRGVQEAIIDSQFGFLVRLLQALCYVGFVYWAARFMNRGAPS